MTFTVERAGNTERDLAAIFDFLIQTYEAFGEDPVTAYERATGRIRGIEDAMESLGKTPYQGTLRPELLPELRSVTKDRTVFYFDIDDERSVVRILAVFFGGQDHQRLMLKRLLGG